MSEPAAKPRPMIDLEEFERRLRRPAATPHPQDDPLSELARLVGGHEDPFKTVFEQNRQAPQPPRAAPAPMSFSRAVPAQPKFTEPQFAEDLPDEDAPLHGTIHPSSYEYEEQPMMADPPAYAAAAEDKNYDWQEPAAPVMAQAAQVAEVPRSRRPLFITAAIIAVGIAGIGASFAYKGKSGSHELATIKAMSGPTKVQPDSPGGTDVPNQDASILDKSPQQTPTGLSDQTERPVDLAQGAALPRTIMADASGSMGAASVPVPVTPAGVQPAQQNIQSYGIGSMIEPKKVKTVSVRSDGTLLPNDTPPQMPSSVDSQAMPQAGHINASGAGATPKPSTPKSTARVVTTPKPAQSMQQLAEDANSGANDTTTIPPAPVPAKPKPAPAKPVKVAEAEATDAIPDNSKNAGGSGAFAVQFAAPASEQEAHEMTAKLSQKYGSELGGHHLTYHRAKVNDKTVFRVRTTGLSREEASGLCEKIKTNGGSCFIAKD